LLADVHFARGEHLRGLDVLTRLKAQAPEADEAVEERARRFRHELATGELEGLVSPKLRAELETRLSALVGEAALLERMRIRLALSRESLIGRMEQILAGRDAVDDETLDELEELLITSDVGAQTSLAIVGKLRKQVAGGRLTTPDELRRELREQMLAILGQSSGRLELRPGPPTVILMVGVNGAGKTTTIAKLAHRFREEGRSVLLVAGDTFRAGAIEQLQIWADRVGVPLIRQQEGSDPSAVAFDGMQAARSRKADVVIVDTAGRLQTKVNLMDELRKIVRVLTRNLEGAPHEVLLVLDGTSGQNALSQARLFSEAAPVSGIVLTKLDGTAKGGIILSIANEMRIPIKLIGIGERMTDLRDFEPALFVEALFGDGKAQPVVSKKASV
jgi:fused signal recognition particle receptor